jgi:inhibitor of cysteine peptidase
MQCIHWISALLVPVALATASLKGGALCENHAMADDEKTITLTVKEKKTELKLAKGDVFELKMEMRAGTGYRWHIAKNDETLLKLKGKPTVERLDKAKPGAAELQVFRFQAEAGGTCDLELHYVRPFDKDKPPEKTYKITLQIAK